MCKLTGVGGFLRLSVLVDPAAEMILEHGLDYRAEDLGEAIQGFGS